MSRKPYIGDAAQLLASRAPANINNNNNNNQQQSARGSSNPRSTSLGGVPTHSSYASRTTTPASGRATPIPNRNGPPQPTPRSTNTKMNHASNIQGLVSTPANNNTAQRRGASSNHLPPPGSASNQRGNASSLLASSSFTNNNQQQQQQQQQLDNDHSSSSTITNIAGQRISIFPRDLAERSGADFKTSEAKASLRMTVDNERQLQELVKARRDRALEMLQMYRGESSGWQTRIDGVKAKLQREEHRRIELAAQAREVETEALNGRHQLRQSQNMARRKGEAAMLAAARNGFSSTSESDEFGGNSKPHSIIQHVLQRFAKTDGHPNSEDHDDGYDSGDDAVYAAVLGKTEYEYQQLQEGSPISGGGYQDPNNNNASWYSNSSATQKNAQKRKRPRLTKHERIQAAGKIAHELEKSLRTTRLSLESRAAELEASLSEIASLENQKIGFGVTVDEMRERVRAVHNSVKQASWMRSCLPLLEQTVRQREALADQGEEYGKKVIANLMALNKRDDEFCSVLQEKVERNLLRPDDVTRTAQEQNQIMSRELGDAIRDAEYWRAQMNATCEKYQGQLREVEKSIDDASKQRRSSIF